MIKKLFNKLFPPRKLTPIEQAIRTVEANYQAGYLKYGW